MFAHKKLLSVTVIAIMILALAACRKTQPGLPCPACVYCTGLGYELVTRERQIGDQEPPPETSAEPTSARLGGPPTEAPVVLEAVCVFPDGNECEHWDFMSGRCGQEYTYCVQQGYTLEPGPNMATCIFPDGSSCLEILFFEGRCGPEGD